MVPSLLKKHGGLRPAWRYRSEGIVWRIIVTPRGRLAGEVRDAEKLEVRFFCVDGATGAALWQHAAFGEQWWIGMETLCCETLFLHKYATPSMPEHRAIIAVEIESGKELWRDEEMRFEFTYGERIVASQTAMMGTQFKELDARTGTVVGTLSEAEAMDARRAVESINSTNIIVPAPIDLVADSSANAALMRSECDPKKLVGPVGFLEHGNFLIFNYHASSPKGRVHNTLTIFDRKNNAVVFHERVHENATTIAAETFFLWQSMLFYLEEQTTLTAIALTETQVQ